MFVFWPGKQNILEWTFKQFGGERIFSLRGRKRCKQSQRNSNYSLPLESHAFSWPLGRLNIRAAPRRICIPGVQRTHEAHLNFAAIFCPRVFRGHEPEKPFNARDNAWNSTCLFLYTFSESGKRTKNNFGSFVQCLGHENTKMNEMSILGTSFQTEDVFTPVFPPLSKKHEFLNEFLDLFVFCFPETRWFTPRSPVSSPRDQKSDFEMNFSVWRNASGETKEWVNDAPQVQSRIHRCNSRNPERALFEIWGLVDFSSVDFLTCWNYCPVTYDLRVFSDKERISSGSFVPCQYLKPDCKWGRVGAAKHFILRGARKWKC